MSNEAMTLALEALNNSVDLVVEDAYNAEKLYGNYPTRQAKVGGLKALAEDHKKAIKALEEALAKQEQRSGSEHLGEPVAYLNPDDVCADTAFRWCKIDEFTQPVYTTSQPAQKPLTREVIDRDFHGRVDFVRQVEAAHGIKENT